MITVLSFSEEKAWLKVLYTNTVSSPFPVSSFFESPAPAQAKTVQQSPQINEQRAEISPDSKS